MKNSFDFSFTLCCSLLLVSFLSLHEATASKQPPLDEVEEADNDNDSKATLSKPRRKLVTRKNNRTPHFPSPEKQEEMPMSMDDLSTSFHAITLTDKPTNDYLSFSTPIAMHKLWLYGKLPQKLSTHRKAYGDLLSEGTAPLLHQFVKDLNHLVANQLLLRADNLDLFKALERLPEDYTALSLFNDALDEPTRSDYITQLIFDYNDVPAKVSPRHSRFQNQWSALAIIKEEVFDYITAQSDCLKETALLSSKLIELTIHMVLPFNDFVQKYAQLISDMEEERAQFFHMMRRHSGITKATIQFSQAESGFPSLIEAFKNAHFLAIEREEKAQREQEQSSLLNSADSAEEPKKPSPPERRSSSGQDNAKRPSLSLRSTLSLDLTWLTPSHGKHSKTSTQKNSTQSTGEHPSGAEPKKRFSSPRKHSPRFPLRKLTTSGGTSPQDSSIMSSIQDNAPLSGESPTTQDSPNKSSSPSRVSGSLESPSKAGRERSTPSPHRITNSEASKPPKSLSRKSSVSVSPTVPLLNSTLFTLETQSLEPLIRHTTFKGKEEQNTGLPKGESSPTRKSKDRTTVTNDLSTTMDPLILSASFTEKQRTPSPMGPSPRVRCNKQKILLQEPSSLDPSTQESSPRNHSPKAHSPEVTFQRLFSSTGDLNPNHNAPGDTAPLRPKTLDNGSSSTSNRLDNPIKILSSHSSEEK